MNRPVSLIELDTQATHSPAGGGLTPFHLSITPPPPGWTDIFDTLWQQNFTMIKRRAHATSQHIIITCMQNELQEIHIPVLKEIVARSNGEWEIWQRNAQEKKLAEEAAENGRKSEIEALARSLKF